MRFEGKIWKSGSHWLIEVPAFEAMTQGHDREEAFAMIRDLIETMVDVPGFEVHVHPGPDDRFEIGSSDVRQLVALFLRRQRESQGLSLAEAAARLNQRSRNAYARYERGEAAPTIEKLEELLRAVVPERDLVWRLAL